MLQEQLSVVFVLMESIGMVFFVQIVMQIVRLVVALQQIVWLVHQVNIRNLIKPALHLLQLNLYGVTLWYWGIVGQIVIRVLDQGLKIVRVVLLVLWKFLVMLQYKTHRRPIVVNLNVHQHIITQQLKIVSLEIIAYLALQQLITVKSV